MAPATISSSHAAIEHAKLERDNEKTRSFIAAGRAKQSNGLRQSASGGYNVNHTLNKANQILCNTDPY